MEKKIEFAPLAADEIEIKVKQVTEKGIVLLPYKTARVDMDRLDSIGAENWSNDYKEIKGNLYCGITINGVTKWDCGIESRTDDDGNEKKGEASDAFKRAGFRWGIGRELYSAPFIFVDISLVNIDEKKRVKDKFHVEKITYDDNRKIVDLIIKNQKGVVVYPKEKSADRQVLKEKPADKQDPTADAMSHYKCEMCGKPFEAFDYKGRHYTEAQAYDLAVNKRGHAICKDCFEKTDDTQQKLPWEG